MGWNNHEGVLSEGGGEVGHRSRSGATMQEDNASAVTGGTVFINFDSQATR
jgi:hypothetical protein